MILKKVQTALVSALESKDYSALRQSIPDNASEDDVFRANLELTFRTFLCQNILNQGNLLDPNLEVLEQFVTFAINVSKEKFAGPTLPTLVLTDCFDLLSLNHSQTLFSCVENNIGTWKDEFFFAPVRNHVLRLCNDLLRRLSRTQNTIFCGRILVFLAKFFPLTERSGLNVISEFNLDNKTTIGEPEDEGQEEKMETDNIEIQEDDKNLNIDYAVYKKFWLLQDFFREPTQCYERRNWKQFITYANDVLGIFQSSKLDSLSGKKSSKSDKKSANEEDFFAKFLTNQNLLQLQLGDSSFRRYILVQFLVLFQYLTATVKFKNIKEVLTDEQSKWISTATDRVNKLLEETPPDGMAFQKAVEHILSREQQWITWKNENCPAFTSKNTEEDEPVVEDKDPRRGRKRLGDQIRDATAKRKFLMGNQNLTKLWNLHPDNLEACAAPERDFLPSLESYFEEAIEQLNPANQVEEQYRKVNNGSWGWRALRLMAKKSPHFFTVGNNPIATLPKYLEQMLRKMCADSTLNLQPSLVLAVSETPSNNESMENGTESTPPPVCTKEALRQVAEKLGDNWVKVLPKLGLSGEAQAEIEAEKESSQDRAYVMFERWLTLEGDQATQNELAYILEGLKMKEVLEGIMEEA